jgi:hypothetical protein
VIPDDDDGQPDDAEWPFDLFGADETGDSSAPAGSLLGAIGQIVGAVLVVLLILAVFIAGAVALRWIFA